MYLKFFENIVVELIVLEGDYCDIKVRRVLVNSKVLLVDVFVGYDLNFGEVYEKRNLVYMGNGVVLIKYIGLRGKSGCNDVNVEFMLEVKGIFNKGNVIW